ncbi:glycosyltransferase family 2 protein [Paenibacillus cymbidii]|uniref:glycosyltransferase family 2 protein n=1 Tax=Paenibacillus cymbidii TaxID=1639034 RepID=UPI0014369500|nr:glycosyltransferase [Paenibacillus cymbidii]
MIGVMLTVFNQLQDTMRTLESFARCTRLPYRLVIVDNASTDKTVRHLMRRGYELIANERSTHGTVRINQGMRHLLANPANRYLVWIHNDMLFFSGWLERLIEHLELDPSIGKLSPVFVNDHDRGPGDAVFAEQWMCKFRHSFYPGNACPWIMKREVFEEVGWFDERYIGVGGYEDWDYNNRMIQRGYDVMITKGSIVWHPMNGTRSKYDEFEATMHNRTYYANKWGTDREIVSHTPEAAALRR